MLARPSGRPTASSPRHRVTRGTRAGVAAVYVGLIAALAIGMDVTFLERDFDDV